MATFARATEPQYVTVRGLWGESITLKLSAKAIRMLRAAGLRPKLASAPASHVPSKRDANGAMLGLYGHRGEGKTCEGCLFMTLLRYHDRSYYKCLKRGTKGAKTDHRLSWDACGLYQGRLSAIEGWQMNSATGERIAPVVRASRNRIERI